MVHTFKIVLRNSLRWDFLCAYHFQLTFFLIFWACEKNEIMLIKNMYISGGIYIPITFIMMLLINQYAS